MCLTSRASNYAILPLQLMKYQDIYSRYFIPLRLGKMRYLELGLRFEITKASNGHCKGCTYILNCMHNSQICEVQHCSMRFLSLRLMCIFSKKDMALKSTDRTVISLN